MEKPTVWEEIQRLLVGSRVLYLSNMLVLEDYMEKKQTDRPYLI